MKLFLRSFTIGKLLSFAMVCLFGVFVLAACKREWLDAKPEKALVVPTTIEDFQALLDNGSGRATAGEVPFNVEQSGLEEVGAGDYYLRDSVWESINNVSEKYQFIWDKDVYRGTTYILEWNYPYQRIFVTNIILEGIENIVPTDPNQQMAWNNVKGGALFHRGYNHYVVAQLFCKPYDRSSAQSDLGIPLRLNSDINAISVRSTVQETYDQIILDLKAALNILPVSLPDVTLYKTRPTKTAALAMLARVYLSMANYDSAFVYADKCLQMYNVIQDYNLDPVKPGSNPPYARFAMPEVIFQHRLNSYISFLQGRLNVDSTLYKSYNTNDLRRTTFFATHSSGQIFFKGSYDGGTIFFSGLSTNEVLLTRAECYVRKPSPDTASGLKDLNDLVRKRWNKLATYPRITATSVNDALQKILLERRKELCFRGLRWTDLRRLNREPGFEVTLRRRIRNQDYILPPNDPRYVLPIPDIVIQMTGMQQNPR